MKIGSIELGSKLFVAPMAGVTDRPFRQLCRRLGAGYAVSEMVTSKRELWHSLKTSRRADHAGEPGPIAVQIAGVDPAEMADAARYNVDRGAQVIDINMGCPAKKVCSVWAGSALMRDEALALRIPVVANGDIDSAEKALAVLEATGADALMIGRAAQGRPWIFREIAHFLATGERAAPPATRDVRGWLLRHLQDHYALHGEFCGVRSARKHIGWAVRALPGGEAFRAAMNTLDDAAAQLQAVRTFFDELAELHPTLPQDAAANDARARRSA